MTEWEPTDTTIQRSERPDSVIQLNLPLINGLLPVRMRSSGFSRSSLGIEPRVPIGLANPLAARPLSSVYVVLTTMRRAHARDARLGTCERLAAVQPNGAVLRAHHHITVAAGRHAVEVGAA
eukprot:250502-Chlamydomonas_euryale.AAC.28